MIWPPSPLIFIISRLYLFFQFFIYTIFYKRQRKCFLVDICGASEAWRRPELRRGKGGSAGCSVFDVTTGREDWGPERGQWGTGHSISQQNIKFKVNSIFTLKSTNKIISYLSFSHSCESLNDGIMVSLWRGEKEQHYLPLNIICDHLNTKFGSVSPVSPVDWNYNQGIGCPEKRDSWKNSEVIILH